MGEGAKKKCVADAKAARKAKKAAEDPDPPSDNNPPAQSKTKNPKKKGTAAPRVHVASVTATRRSTRSNIGSLSGKKDTSAAKDYNNENKSTHRERSATIAAKALLDQLKISEDEDTTDFDQDPQADGESNDDWETDMIMELDGNDDGAIGDDDDDDSDGNGSEIEVVEDGNLKTKHRGLVAPAKATRKDLPNANEEESSSSDEDGESDCWTRHSRYWSIY